MSIEVNDGGVWKEVIEPHINDAGVWKLPEYVYVNADGTNWKQVWPDASGGGGGGSVQLAGDYVFKTNVSPSGPAVAQLIFNSTGAANAVDGLDFNWLLSGAAADFEIQATIVSETDGNFNFAAGPGTSTGWLSMGADRDFWFSVPNGSWGFGSVTIEIRDVATSTVQATKTYNFEGDATT